MTTAEFTLLAAGIFFMNGLLTGVWKYVAMMRNEKARAPYYVDIAHRASLMYAFAAILIREFIPYVNTGLYVVFSDSRAGRFCGAIVRVNIEALGRLSNNLEQ